MFESYSKGNFNEWGDIDLAILSENFEGNRIKDRYKVRSITLYVISSIELLPYATNDFSPDN